MNYCGKKFAVVSHVLPPLPSGQSVLLYRLLQSLPADKYCLIDTGTTPLPVDGRLPGRHERLEPVPQVRKIGPLAQTRIFQWINALWGIYNRSRQIQRIVEQVDCDLIIGCTGDLYDLPATWLAARKTGRPFVAYILDDYINQWTGYSRKIAGYFERKVIAGSRSVFVLNEFVKNEYLVRYGVDAKIIHNPIDLPDLNVLDGNDRVFCENVKNIVYAGSVYHAQKDSFINFVKALDLLNDKDIRFHIYSSQTKNEIETQGIKSEFIEFHPHMPNDKILVALRQADLLFLPLAFRSQIQEVIRTSAPFKTSEYLAVSRPIFVHAPKDSFLSWYFTEHNCGFVVDCDDVEAVRQGLLAILSNKEMQIRLAANARTMAEADFSKEKIAPMFISFLNESLAPVDA